MSGNDIVPGDRAILRELGAWQSQAAATAANRAKIAAWLAHDAHAPDRRPMVLFERRDWRGDEGPIRAADLRCAGAWARRLEMELRLLRHHVETLGDDHVVPAAIACAYAIQRGDFGVPSGRHREVSADALSHNYGAAPLAALDDADFARLRPAEFRHDREATERRRERLEAVFDGILPVRMRESRWQFSAPLTGIVLDLVGQERFLLLFHDNPRRLHRLMRFISDNHLRFFAWMEAENLWTLNNEDDFIGAGSVGYTRDLPAAGFDGRVRCRDRWAGFESQESVGIGPRRYEEFVFPCQREMMARFGKVYYGCCEPVDHFWECLARVPNLARVSVSPWADQEFMGRVCRQHKLVFSRKPSPNFISGERFDEGAFRAHIAETVAAARGCSLEFVQRDIYTLGHKPERMRRWVEIVREECARWRP